MLYISKIQISHRVTQRTRCLTQAVEEQEEGEVGRSILLSLQCGSAKTSLAPFFFSPFYIMCYEREYQRKRDEGQQLPIGWALRAVVCSMLLNIRFPSVSLRHCSFDFLDAGNILGVQQQQQPPVDFSSFSLEKRMSRPHIVCTTYKFETESGSGCLLDAGLEKIYRTLLHISIHFLYIQTI